MNYHRDNSQFKSTNSKTRVLGSLTADFQQIAAEVLLVDPLHIIVVHFVSVLITVLCGIDLLESVEPIDAAAQKFC